MVMEGSKMNVKKPTSIDTTVVILTVAILIFSLCTGIVHAKTGAKELRGTFVESYDGEAKFYDGKNYYGNVTVIELQNPDNVVLNDGFGGYWSDPQGTYMWDARNSPGDWSIGFPDYGNDIYFINSVPETEVKGNSTYVWAARREVDDDIIANPVANMTGQYESIPKPENRSVGDSWIEIEVESPAYTDSDGEKKDSPGMGTYDEFVSYSVFVKGGEYGDFTHIGNTKKLPEEDYEKGDGLYDDPIRPMLDDKNPNNVTTGLNTFNATGLNSGENYIFKVRMNIGEGLYGGFNGGYDNAYTTWGSGESVEIQTKEVYNLTLNAEEGGTTQPAPGSYTYPEETEVTVEAVPDENWTFEKWKGDYPDGKQEEKVIDVAMDRDKTLTANFTQEPFFDVTIDSYDEELVEGDDLTVNYTVKNIGGLEDTQDINFEVYYNETGDPVGGSSDSDSGVTLGPGETKTGNFSWTTGENDANDYYFQVWSQNDTEERSFKVLDEFNLTIEAPKGEGNISVNGNKITEYPFKQKFVEDDVVGLEAVPDEGYHFVEWTGDNDTIKDRTANQTTIEILDNCTITAEFEINTYKLEISSTDGGIVTQPGEGTHHYDHGTEVNLEAVADEGYHFVEWTGDNDTIGDKTANATYIEMLDNYTLTAEFAINTYELTVSSTENGTVTTPKEGTHHYDHGKKVDLEAVADEGYHFIEWKGDNDTIADTTSNNTYIKMFDNYTITADFEINTYTLEMTSTDGGNVTQPGEETYEYDHGTTIDIEAVAHEGQSFVKWSGDNDTVADTSSNFTTLEILDDYTIMAVFDVETCELTIDSTEGGKVVQPGETTYTYNYGDMVDLSAVSDEGYHFSKWTGDNGTIEDVTANQTTIEMLDNYAITAEFEINTYTLDISSTSNGSVVEPGEGSHQYDHGTTVALEAVADEGYHFVEWTGDNGTITDKTANATSIEMLDDYSITAEFKINTYTLDISSTSGGSVIEPGEGTHQYEHGTTVALEAVADEGYLFDEWSGDVVTIDDPNSNKTSITMEDDHSISASFLQEATFEVTDLRVSPTELYYEYDTLTAKADVYNHGDIEDDYTVEFSMDGETIGSDTVTVPGGGSVTAEVDYTPVQEDVGVRTISVEDPYDGELSQDVTISDHPNVTTDSADEDLHEAILYGDLAEIGLEDNVTAYFRYREEGETQWIETTEQNITQEGSFEQSIEGLESNTTYEFRAVIVWNGREDVGTIETFKTLREPFFEVEITNSDEIDECVEGKIVTVNYTVKNTGDVSDTQDIKFFVDDELTETNKNVTVEGRGNYSDFFKWAAEEPCKKRNFTVESEDTYEKPTTVVLEAPQFQVDITSPENGVEVIEGENVTVEYTVTNTGEVSDTQDIEFYLDDGSIDDREDIHLEGGETYSGTFTWTAEAPYEERTLNVTSEDDSREVKVTVLEDAFFEVEITSPEEGEEFEENETITVDYSITNTGDVLEGQNIEFYVDGESVETQEDVAIDSGETYSGSFEWKAEDPGEFSLEVESGDDSDDVLVAVEEAPPGLEPAHFQIEIIECDHEVNPGEEVCVTYKVKNTGGEKATQKIKLLIYEVDGEVKTLVSGEDSVLTIEDENLVYEDSKSVLLEGEESREGEFTWTPEEPGEYKLTFDYTDPDVPVETPDPILVSVEEETSWWWLWLLLLLLLAAMIAIWVMKERKDFKVEILDHNNVKIDGKNILSVDYEVTNLTRKEKTEDLRFNISDQKETIIGDKELTLEGKDSSKGRFVWKTKELGEYEIRIASEDDEDSVAFTVPRDI